MGVMNFIDRCNEEVLVLSDCDVICNVDIVAVMKLHEKRGADFTMITTTVDTALQPLDSHTEMPVVDEVGRVIDLAEYNGEEGRVKICADIWIANRTYLKRVVSEAIAHGYKSFYKDVIMRNIARDKFYAQEYDGFFARINSLESYFRCSMRLLEPTNRVNLFYRRNQSIFTKVRNSVPTRYTADAKVSGSMIADGCVIEGTVENSILFRGVKVGKGTVVKNSILMQDTVTGDNVRLSCVITDKNVMIRDGRELCGCESMPFYIGKGVMV
jgi:glucose-1-phosphate adenylyltransferase